MNQRIRDAIHFAGVQSGYSVRKIQAAGDSSAGQTFIAEADDFRLFLKVGSGQDAGRLAAESGGLRMLRSAKHSLVVPNIVYFGPASADEGETLTVLATEFLERVAPESDHEERLACGLAELHRSAPAVEMYGAADSGFIGLGLQPGGWSSSWSSFFLSARLDPMVAVARKKERWHSGWDGAYGRLRDQIAEILPDDPGISLVHGDLWSGNVIPLADAAAIIDPAAYHGDREVDIAMTELFGGFGPRFYHAYNDAFPLVNGYEERRSIYNLYHLINHLNIFGSAYAGRVAATLKQFS